MNHYRTYMDRQQVSGDLHRRLISLRPAPRKKPWTGVAALAACCLLAVGVWRFSETPPSAAGTPPIPTEQPGSVPTLSPDQSGGAPTLVAGSGEGSSGNLQLPMIPALNYGGAPSIESSDKLVSPPGSYSVELTGEQILTLLWGGDDSFTDVPWLLQWEGFALSAAATYDGEGNLWLLRLSGTQGADRFELTLAPDRLPPSCVEEVPDGTTDVRGVTVTSVRRVYDCNGDGIDETVRECAFLAHGVGVRADFRIQETPSSMDLCALLVNWATYEDRGLSLDHLLVNGDIPDWESLEFRSFDQALAVERFVPYLPRTAPAGWDEFYGRLEYQEGREDCLWVRWSRGCDSVEIEVFLPEGELNGFTPVDPAVPESYDVRLYQIPWADSVPAEYRQDFYSPTFRAEDLTRDILAARQTEKDTGGTAIRFSLLHPDGTVVTYILDRLTVDEAWALIRPSLP